MYYSGGGREGGREGGYAASRKLQPHTVHDYIITIPSFKKGGFYNSLLSYCTLAYCSLLLKNTECFFHFFEVSVFFFLYIKKCLAPWSAVRAV